MPTRAWSVGKSSLRILPLGLLGAELGILVAWPYQALVTWVPYICINALVYIGFMIALDAIAYLVSNFGKNRNRWLGALLGVAITCATCTGDTYLTVTQSWTDGDQAKSAEIHEDVVMTRAEREQLIALGQELRSGTVGPCEV